MIPLMLAALILLQTECLKSYLVACKIFKPFPYIYATTLLFHIFMCYILFCIGHLAF
jgi:MATE family multidrug resistance protein